MKNKTVGGGVDELKNKAYTQTHTQHIDFLNFRLLAGQFISLDGQIGTIICVMV